MNMQGVFVSADFSVPCAAIWRRRRRRRRRIICYIFNNLAFSCWAVNLCTEKWCSEYSQSLDAVLRYGKISGGMEWIGDTAV
jgi:hypothetical protein